MKIALYAAVLVSLLIYPERCAAAAKQALCIWGLDVVPSLFPYIVFCRMIASSLAHTRVPALAAVPLLGLFGGSPSGASALSAYDDNGHVPSCAYGPLAVLCGVVSPMFLMQTLGQWGCSAQLRTKLLLSQLMGAAAASAISRSMACPLPPLKQIGHSTGHQGDAIAKSIQGVLNIGACIMVFSVLAEIIGILLPAVSHGLAGALVHAMLEMAGGIRKICMLHLPQRHAAVAIAFCAGFSGCSVLLQNHSQLRGRLPMTYLSVFALLRGILCAVCAWILC